MQCYWSFICTAVIPPQKKAISKAISIPKHSLWRVHFKCPPTTTVRLNQGESYVTKWEKEKKHFKLATTLKAEITQQWWKYNIPWKHGCPSSVCAISVNDGSIILFNGVDCAASGKCHGGFHNMSSTCWILIKQMRRSHLLWYEIKLKCCCAFGSQLRYFCCKPFEAFISSNLEWP